MSELTDRLGIRVLRPENVSSPRDEDLEQLTRLAFRVAYGVLRNPEDAEEVAQDSMITLCRKFGTLRNPQRSRAWLVRVAWRRAIDRQRADKRREKREGVAPLATVSHTPEEITSAQQRAALLRQAIDELPEPQRQAVILVSIQSEDLASVATLTGTPVGTLKSRLFHARRNLLEKLRCLAHD